MKSCSLDTNAVLALLLPGRESEQLAVERQLKVKECHISDLVFSEVEYVFSKGYEMKRGAIVDNIRAIINIDNVNCNKTMLRQVLPLYEKHKTVSFVDICLAVQARLNDAEPLYTFDKKLARDMPEANLL